MKELGQNSILSEDHKNASYVVRGTKKQLDDIVKKYEWALQFAEYDGIAYCIDSSNSVNSLNSIKREREITSKETCDLCGNEMYLIYDDSSGMNFCDCKNSTLYLSVYGEEINVLRQKAGLTWKDLHKIYSKMPKQKIIEILEYFISTLIV
jgi:hypothetical protein